MADETETAAAPSLRDSLAAGLAEAQESSQPEPPAAAAVADTRTRDEAGRFAKEEKERAQAQTGATVSADVGAVAAGVERPSTWKKDYWEKYDKLDPDLRAYILQRENEYKSGLATYNLEVKAAKTLKDAIEPFLPELQRHNIDPSAWIRNLGNAHQTLALGSPQAKLQIFQRLAQDYGVPLQYLVPNQQGQVQQLDPTLQYLANNLQGLKQQWDNFQSQQQAAE